MKRTLRSLRSHKNKKRLGQIAVHTVEESLEAKKQSIEYGKEYYQEVERMEEEQFGGE